MPMFQALPVVIEAIQYLPYQAEKFPQEVQDEISDFVDLNVEVIGDDIGIDFDDRMLLVRPGDWVIKNIDGTFTTCDGATFAQMFKAI